jgi:hypothetical protein
MKSLIIFDVVIENVAENGLNVSLLIDLKSSKNPLNVFVSLSYIRFFPMFKFCKFCVRNGDSLRRIVNWTNV